MATGRGVAALGALGTAILAAGLLLRLPAAVGVAAAALGGAYALEVVVEGARLDRGAPLVGVLLLLVCELGYWSHELRTTSPDEAGVRARHVAWLCVLGLGTLAAAVALEATAELARIEGVAIDVLGALAAVGALALLARIAISAGLAPRRARGPHVEPERAEEAPWRGA
ncbi:MAG: hypothetical protein OEV72_02920 [Thermoleophilia bacterium]|nr:hypothetical protein [Thermoleophilia bacterium]MDH5334250.1 hypothetical protein [Thermoleophilia bacterium]